MKKNKHFYGHLVETTDITLELGNVELTPEERVHLLSLVEANIHAAVMNTVLSSLDEENKKIFLSNIVINEHDKTLEHLKTNESEIEKRIKKTIEDVKKELLNDIKDLRQKK